MRMGGRAGVVPPQPPPDEEEGEDEEDESEESKIDRQLALGARLQEMGHLKAGPFYVPNREILTPRGSVGSRFAAAAASSPRTEWL